jgi:bifunctional DNA-binding transcriptional regulator/antitoxin component of YhaV-PrlF toxin-antitoxin module
MKSKVSLRGQVSIPSFIRKKFAIEPESQINWRIEGNTIRIVPLPKDPVGAFKGKGLGKYSTGQLIRDRRNERKKEN